MSNRPRRSTKTPSRFANNADEVVEEALVEEEEETSGHGKKRKRKAKDPTLARSTARLLLSPEQTASNTTLNSSARHQSRYITPRYIYYSMVYSFLLFASLLKMFDY